MLIPVILSGGSGTRLWPLSRELYPKQLLPLITHRTMLQETAARLNGVKDLTAPIVVCNDAHRFMVAEQLRSIDVPVQAIVLEPVGRNTAPAVAVAALIAQQDAAAERNDPVLLVLPADHALEDVTAFHAAIAVAYRAAADGKLVTFGVVARKPETGYGYIRRGEELTLTPALSRNRERGEEASANRSAGTAFISAGAVFSAGTAFKVAEFVEKPDKERAGQFIASGEYFWNSGMFMFKASRFLQELTTFAPDIDVACRKAVAGAARDLDFTRLPAEAFGACRSESIDYAVMEKTRDAVVVPLDAGWSDVGSWSALHEASKTDASANAMHGDVIAEDINGCYLYSSSRLVAAVGLTDHVVVETKDAVLVAPKSRVQDVKLLVNRLKKEGRYEISLHREVFRPWGSYDNIDNGHRFQVKRLVVKPGAVLSLQSHHHRAEHWVVVSGTARITRGEEVFLLEENQSTYIPIGVKHRIENPGKIPLHIVEVQSGSYLGEDDIVRFEDNYGRKGTTT